MRRSETVCVNAEGLKVLRVNEDIYWAMAGEDLFHYNYVGSRTFQHGEKVLIVPVGIIGEQPFNFQLVRYVDGINNPFQMMSDDYYATLILSAFKPDK